jgi:hypothetical protein
VFPRIVPIKISWAVGGALVFGAIWTGYTVFISEKTPGERFVGVMKQRENSCVRGPTTPGDTSCDILKLKPEDPLATPEGRHAHSIQLPEPERRAVYRKGLTGQQYFNELCEAEAGDFILKTAPSVEGLLEMRRRPVATDYLLQHLYALEDPFGVAYGDMAQKPQDYWVQPNIGKYAFMEAINPESRNSADRYMRFYKDLQKPHGQYQTQHEGVFVSIPYVVSGLTTGTLRSRFGYTWRGLSRPHDREHGIAGGEFIVMDLENHEVLGFRRGFVKSGKVRNVFTHIWWLAAEGCPQNAVRTTEGLRKRFNYEFVYSVLTPKPPGAPAYSGEANVQSN